MISSSMMCADCGDMKQCHLCDLCSHPTCEFCSSEDSVDGLTCDACYYGLYTPRKSSRKRYASQRLIDMATTEQKRCWPRNRKNALDIWSSENFTYYYKNIPVPIADRRRNNA